ncbi:MAG: aldehyde ferredoxin oxidoreductase [Pseudomonadota bacterium]
MTSFGGWAGKVLRVDLSSGRVSKEDTIEKYKDVVGGTGLGYQTLWEEVPAHVKPFDPENKLVFATGPLAGTSAPSNGRTAITTIFPTCWPKPLVGSGHFGGDFASELKYAGYDAIIVEGKADRPVWLAISDHEVKIRDARSVWGQGIRRSTLELAQQMGSEASIAAIGPAGENLIPMSNVMNNVSHSAGGVGAVMGAKNLKAIAVRGSGYVRIAGDKREWEKLIKYHLSLLGANNQHTVPSSPQPWSEFSAPTSRWVGGKGKRWGAADPPLDVGVCDPHDLNSIAFRSNSAAFFLGDIAWKYTVRGNGCGSCPVRCHTLLRAPHLTSQYGLSPMVQSTCVRLFYGRSFYKSFPDGHLGRNAFDASLIGVQLIDDLGLWDNYGQVQRDFIKLYHSGLLKGIIGPDEFKKYSWDKYEKGDPSFLLELIPNLANKGGELGTALGLGTGYMLERWGLSEDDWKKDHATRYWKFGHPQHHSSDEAYQLGAIINTQYNRDVQCHTHTNFLRNPLPVEVRKKLAADLWGSEDAVDPLGEYTPMNPAKAKMTKWTLLRKELHDSLALCNYMAPVAASPLKERGYSGDDTLESLLYSLATGDRKSREELDEIGLRIFTLHRALTMRGMNSREMRREHDTIPAWVYKDLQNRPPFTKGTVHMDPRDLELGLDMFYDEVKWDRRTGAPTKSGLLDLKLGYVADELGKKGLLP